MNEKQLLENKYWIARLAKEATEEIPDQIGEDNSSKLGEVQDRIQSIQSKIYGHKPPTVQSIVQELYELTSATFFEPISVSELQGLFYMEIEALADLLGVELKDDW